MLRIYTVDSTNYNVDDSMTITENDKLMFVSTQISTQYYGLYNTQQQETPEYPQGNYPQTYQSSTYWSVVSYITGAVSIRYVIYESVDSTKALSLSPGTYTFRKGYIDTTQQSGSNYLTVIVVQSDTCIVPVNVSGTWKDQRPYVKAGGTWREAKGFVKVSGTWKPLISPRQPGPYGYQAVDIQISTQNPDTRCSYPQTITVNGQTVNNSCYGFTPAKSQSNSFDMGSWVDHSIISGIKPVSKNGSIWTDLATNASTWTDTSNDIFTEFPFNWLSITSTNTRIRIIFSDNDTQPDSTFQCYAHAKGCDSYTSSQITSALSSASRSTIMKSNNNNYFANSFHIGCFHASGGSSGQQVYSKKDQTATHVAYAYYFQGANARGTDYDIMSFQQWTYLQALFVLLYKSTNSQTQHSQGLAKVGSESLSVNNTNSALSTTAYGMAGTVGSAQRNAFFWIHDLWGNMYQFIGGLWNRAQSTKDLYYWLPRQSNSRAFNNGWTQATSYATQANMGELQASSSSASGSWITTVYGTNVAGFAPAITSGGSSSTYFPDNGVVDAHSSSASFPYVGGSAGASAGRAGIFYCNVRYTSAYSSTYNGSRLSYRGGRT